MVKLGDPHPQGPLAIAQSLAAAGLQVLPARHQEKAPIVKWTEYQTVRTENMLVAWFGGGARRNYWVMTGRISGHVVIDCDSPEGETWWRNLLGDDVLDNTARVKTAKGHHYWFAIPHDWDEEVSIASWGIHDEVTHVSFDFRADGTGVIVPPSIHESGVAYRWETPLEEAALAPPAILDGTARSTAPATTPGVTAGTGGNTRSMLGQLLGNPPGAEGSGRNDWLARVAGHYAKQYHNLEDLYKVHCAQANNLMGQPLDESEFNKTIESVWRGEHERNPQRALDAECGWLQSAGTRIMTQVVIKGPNDSREFDVAEYANFDIQATGVMVDDKHHRTYWVNLHIRRPGSTDTQIIDTVLPANTLGDNKKFNDWISHFSVNVLPPRNIYPQEGGVATRIARYLESQHPPQVVITPALGFDQEILDGKGGFVTHEGVITADEVFESNAIGVRADPRLLSGFAPHHYGFEGDAAEARRVLDEVLSFQDETVTSVFGAWWAACLLKPQFLRASSIFPVMAIEAPSESGKTNGFFQMMIQLNGNTRGEMIPTKAALRDMLASHHNGISWVDDLDDPAYLMELVRAVTSGGSLAKMGEDHDSVKNATMISPLVLSGEALGLGTQKALLDRTITLKAKSPANRTSRHIPDRPQWDDVLTLRQQYGTGLSVLAGWFVQDALSEVDNALAALKAAGKGQGRAGDKVAVVRAGARLLDALLSDSPQERSRAWAGEGAHARRVDKWAEDVALGTTAENSLTTELVPWALAHFEFPEEARARKGIEKVDVPVWIEDKRLSQTTLDDEERVTVWVCAKLLADAWEDHKRGRVEARTTTYAALKDQLDALNLAKANQFKVIGGGGRKFYYRPITGQMALDMITRAQGK